MYNFAVIILFIVHFFTQLYKLPCSYTVWPQTIWIKVRTSWQIQPQHQSTYLGGPESASFEIPSFKPHFIKFQKKFFSDWKKFKEQLLFGFLCIVKQKKLSERFLKNLLHKKRLKGGISIDADSKPSRCCDGICHQPDTFY